MTRSKHLSLSLPAMLACLLVSSSAYADCVKSFETSWKGLFGQPLVIESTAVVSNADGSSSRYNKVQMVASNHAQVETEIRYPEADPVRYTTYVSPGGVKSVRADGTSGEHEGASADPAGYLKTFLYTDLAISNQAIGSVTCPKANSFAYELPFDWIGPDFQDAKVQAKMAFFKTADGTWNINGSFNVPGGESVTFVNLLNVKPGLTLP